MTRILFLIALAWAIGSAIFAGCGAAPQRGEELMESVMTYHDGLRWERLAVAASRVPPKEREDFVDERDQLAEHLRITDWEVKRVRSDGSSRARVHVKYTWYRDDEGVVRETHALQKWERRGKAWLILEEWYLRGEEMPGLHEKEEEEESEGEEGEDPEGGQGQGQGQGQGEEQGEEAQRQIGQGQGHGQGQGAPEAQIGL